MIEDDMVGWHHRLKGHEFGQTPRDSEGQGNLVCCNPLGRKESDTTERLSLSLSLIHVYTGRTSAKDKKN